MLHPVLTLLVAGSFHLSAESPWQADLADIVYEITLAVEHAQPDPVMGEPELTICDIPYYYSDFTPVTARHPEPFISYDWRSPVIFDLP
jgi:hypothetical protein